MSLRNENPKLGYRQIGRNSNSTDTLLSGAFGDCSQQPLYAVTVGQQNRPCKPIFNHVHVHVVLSFKTKRSLKQSVILRSDLSYFFSH